MLKVQHVHLALYQGSWFMAVDLEKFLVMQVDQTTYQFIMMACGLNSAQRF